MDRSAYLTLRAHVESEVISRLGSAAESDELINAVMRHICTAEAVQVSKRANAKRDFLTFRRDRCVTAPSWAYRKPGTVPALPSLR